MMDEIEQTAISTQAQEQTRDEIIEKIIKEAERHEAAATALHQMASSLSR
jgi:hypothetical protein